VGFTFYIYKINTWEKSAYKVLVEKPEEKRPLRRPTHRCEGVGWIHRAQDTDQ
jgi:hypothetical protein